MNTYIELIKNNIYNDNKIIDPEIVDNNTKFKFSSNYHNINKRINIKLSPKIKKHKIIVIFIVICLIPLTILFFLIGVTLFILLFLFKKIKKIFV